MKKLLTALALVAGVFVIAGQSASATTVHHQDCPEGWTQIVSQPPHAGFSVTATHTGNLWIKVATQHFEVPVVSVGDVVTPADVSSWPTNQNGRYQEISHVDYCVPPEVTTTTAPEVTTTTAPEVTTTTQPEVTTTTQPEVTTTTAPEVTTTTVVETTTTQPATTLTQAPTTSAPPTATPQSMPVTGSDMTGTLATIAGLLTLAGGTLVAARRRG